jgi:hypothetical protein
VCKLAHSYLAVTLIASCAAAAPEKKFKSQEEYDLYTHAGKDIAASNFAKAVTDLDAWRQKFPESDYRDDGQLLYVQAWSGAKQPAKALDAAAQLIRQASSLSFGSADLIKLLYTTSLAIQQAADPTPEQLATGAQAAQQLLTYNQKPDGVADDAWAQARSQLQTAARVTLVQVAIVPAAQALKKNDCAAAESAGAKALASHPDSAQAAWYMGLAHLCSYKAQPEKVSPALYELARAAALDPVKGIADPEWQRKNVEPYLEKIYNQYHGNDPQGLKELKQSALGSPLAPAGFKIKSQPEILEDKQAEFETRNPQLALWMKIKAALSGAAGEEYFTSSFKDSNVPQLKGVLVEAKPACRPKELLVSVPLPDSPAGQPEIVLKLDKPLAGKPDIQSEFHWQGVPAAFTQNPFRLTMETEAAKVEGLQLAPCAVAPARRTVPRKK